MTARWTLSVDPGTTVVGWCLWTPAGDLSRIDVIRTKGDRPWRLWWIFDSMRRILEPVPDSEGLDVAIERAFVGRNPSTAIIIGEGRGAILAACGTKRARVFEYSPMTAKKGMTGKGNADKELVADWAIKIYNLTDRPPLDATDALAVGHCHLGRLENGSG